MPSKRSAKDRAAEQADFKTWLADAVAELRRQHNIDPAIIPQRMWRHLYTQGRCPQKARRPGSGFRLQHAVGCRSAQATIIDELPFKVRSK